MNQLKDHILILGAGLMQRPAIQSARKLGLKVTVIDANPNAMCIPLADNFEPVDLKDKEKIRSLALNLKETDNLKAVFTAGTDFSASVSYASEACGFSAHSFEAALNASDKVRMRQCFKNANVPSPNFLQADKTNLESICTQKDKLKGFSYPLVIKPVDNMGGRGCRLVRTEEELENALKDAIANSKSQRAIIEDYMEGPEFSIDAIVYNGTITICGFADRHIFFPPYFIEMGHTMPTIIDEENKLKLIVTFAKGIQALGLTCGVAKADIKLTEKGPMIGEIAARLSGGYMSGWTYPYSSDCPLTEQAQLVALGKEPEWLVKNRQPVNYKDSELSFELYDVPSKRTCAERAWISIPGTVQTVYGLENLQAGSNIKDVFPRSSQNDNVVFPHNNVEKCGNVLCVSEKRENAISDTNEFISNIVLRLKTQNKETDSFLKDKNNSFPPDAFQLPVEIKEKLNAECPDTTCLSVSHPVKDKVPPCLLPYMDSVTDWNHRTLNKTIELYDKIRVAESSIPQKSSGSTISANLFWKACLRGGIQGMLYVTDSISEGLSSKEISERIL